MVSNPVKAWQFWLGVGLTVFAFVIVYMIWKNSPSSEDVKEAFKAAQPKAQPQTQFFYPEYPTQPQPQPKPPRFVLVSTEEGTPNERRVERAPPVEDVLPPLPQDFITKIMPISTRDSKGEKECRRVLEKMFGVPFLKIRSKYLHNDIRGGDMELDCFSPQVTTFTHNGTTITYNGLAVEYNGEGHIREDHIFNATKQAFMEQAYRDQRKIELCDHYGIYLITVDYTVKIQDIENYIRYYLPDAVMARGGA